MAVVIAHSRWLPYRRPVPDPAVRLFCLPHAGGSASVFRQWPRRLPSWVEVCAVQLPARETRWRDEPAPTLAALVDDLAEALDPLLDARYALCGTSFGALLAYTLAHRLRERGRPGPVRLFVAAMPPPDRLRPVASDPRHLAPHVGTGTSVAGAGPGAGDASVGGGGEGIGGVSAELAGLVRRALGHDVHLAAAYRHTDRPPLDCAITVFGGRADPTVPTEDLAGWASHTTAGCSTHLLPGDHFFFRDSASTLIAQVATDLRPHAP